MSFIFEKVTNSSQKSQYTGANSFLYVSRTSLHPIAKNWITEPCFLPTKYEQYADEIANLEVRKDDVWIVSYPKCGTTWCQEMIWMLCNNLDYKTSLKVSLHERYSFIEFDTLFDIPNNHSELNKLRNLKSPRFIKTHLPAQLLPTEIWNVKPKIIYITRNPKDAAVSFYHHFCNMIGYKGTFNEYMEAYLANEIVYAPFHSHVVNFWNIRNDENILFLTYKQMKSDLMSVLESVQMFLKTNYKHNELEKLQDHLGVDSMRANGSINNEILVGLLLSLTNEQKIDKGFT